MKTEQERSRKGSERENPQGEHAKSKADGELTVCCGIEQLPEVSEVPAKRHNDDIVFERELKEEGKRNAAGRKHKPEAEEEVMAEFGLCAG